MQKSKLPLARICAIGGWKFGAGQCLFAWWCVVMAPELCTGSVTSYLDQCELEQDIALEVAILSDEEEWIS